MPCLAPGNLTLVKPCDFDLGKCGAPVSPDSVFIDLPKAYVFTLALAANSVQLDLRQLLDDKGEFILKAISAVSSVGHNYFVRFQFPNGRYHSNARVHNAAYSLGQGGQRLLIDPVVKCPAAAWIGIELENQTGVIQPVCLTFEGARRAYLK